MDYVLTNCNLFVNGFDLLGKVEEIKVPELAAKTEEFRLAGMVKPREFKLGYEKLEFSFKMPSLDPRILAQHGIEVGVDHQFLAAGALKDDRGEVKAAALHMTGFFRKLGMGTWKPGEKTDVENEVAVHSFRLLIDGLPVLAVDDFSVIVGGVDQTAAERAALLSRR